MNKSNFRRKITIFILYKQALKRKTALFASFYDVIVPLLTPFVSIPLLMRYCCATFIEILYPY